MTRESFQYLHCQWRCCQQKLQAAWCSLSLLHAAELDLTDWQWQTVMRDLQQQQQHTGMMRPSHPLLTYLHMTPTTQPMSERDIYLHSATHWCNILSPLCPGQHTADHPPAYVIYALKYRTNHFLEILINILLTLKCHLAMHFINSRPTNYHYHTLLKLWSSLQQNIVFIQLLHISTKVFKKCWIQHRIRKNNASCFRHSIKSTVHLIRCCLAQKPHHRAGAWFSKDLTMVPTVMT